MDIQLDDGSLFGNDAGEDEDEFVLISYFVDKGEFEKFLDPSIRFAAAKGRKGTGKSALLVRFAHDLRAAADAPLVHLTAPSSLVALREPPQTEDPALLTNYWKQVICGAINMQLAREVGFAWRDDEMALVESAEVAGYKGRNLLGALANRLLAKISLGGAIEIAPKAAPAANHEQLLKRLSQADGQGPGGFGRKVWFLLDDIDARFENSPRQRALIASFFAGAREIVREIEGIGIRATIRSDVWAGLTGEDLDKSVQYLAEISWSASDQKSILANRILGYIKRKDPASDTAVRCSYRDNAEELIGLAFGSRLRWGGAMVPADHVLRQLGGGRPRWIAQLCRLAGENATRDGQKRIELKHINEAMGEFGRRRLGDLVREYGYQFSDLEALIESFSGGPRRFTTRELLDRITLSYIKPTGIQRVPAIDGRRVNDARQLAHFLFRCGFINGRYARPTLEVPEFVSFEMRPTLLRVDTAAEVGLTWEILPAYRNVLQTQDEGTPRGGVVRR